MIRNFETQDLDKIMELWLNTNVMAHSFIDDEYWVRNYDNVKSMLPNSTVYVYEENGVVHGFIGLMKNYVAGIFVSQQLQSNGIGKQLLDYVKSKINSLTLNVYKENSRAVDFYIREGFTVLKEQVDENTGEIEFVMNWENEYN